jgi:hypothetical protein
MEYWSDGFKRDLNIESQVRLWEHISTGFLEVIFIYQSDVKAGYHGSKERVYANVFDLIFRLTFGGAPDPEHHFKAAFIKKVRETLAWKVPPFDLEEAFPVDDGPQ